MTRKKPLKSGSVIPGEVQQKDHSVQIKLQIIFAAIGAIAIVGTFCFFVAKMWFQLQEVDKKVEQLKSPIRKVNATDEFSKTFSPNDDCHTLKRTRRLLNYTIVKNGCE